MKRTDIRQAIFDVIQQMPGLTANEVALMMPNNTYANITGRLTEMYDAGLLQRERKAVEGAHWPMYHYSTLANTFSWKYADRVKRRTPHRIASYAQTSQ